MNRYTSLAAALALLFTSNATLADSGFYLGASVGSAELDDSFGGLEIDDTNTAYRLVGGWRFNNYFAVEAGWQDFGDFEQTLTLDGQQLDISLGADGYTLGVTGSYPLGSRFELYGRAGAFFWDGEAEINAVGQSDPGDTNPYLGAGLGFALTEAFLVTGDFTRFDLEDTESDVWSIGFQFRF